jgi:hypothetical protein
LAAPVLIQTATPLEQITAQQRFIKQRGPAFCGVFLFQVSVMRNQSDFFQEQIKKCNGLAERASNETDRNFWLRMARRWEVMLEAGESGTLNVEVKETRPPGSRGLISPLGRRRRG